MILAAKKLCDATGILMGATAASHKEIKQNDPNVYRQDPNWSTGIAQASRGIADNISQLVDISCDPNATPEEIVAAARCVNSSAESLVGFTRQKMTGEYHTRSDLETAARGIAKATNFLVEMAKQANGAADTGDYSNIKNADRSKQLQMEFEAQAEIAKLEAELDEARDYLFKLKRTLYGGNPTGGTAGMPIFSQR